MVQIRWKLVKTSVAQWRRIGLNFRYHFINQARVKLNKIAMFKYYVYINSNCVLSKTIPLWGQVSKPVSEPIAWLYDIFIYQRKGTGWEWLKGNYLSFELDGNLYNLHLPSVNLHYTYFRTVIPIPRHSQTRTKNADLETWIIMLKNLSIHINV